MASVLLLISVLLSVGLLVILVTALLIAQSLLRPPRMTDGKAVYILQRLSPGDMGLQYSVVGFDVPDEAVGGRTKIHIAGWWIPHPANGSKCVVFIHGYADAKVGAIAWAPVWHALGYHILAIDLRAHGESGGRNCTGGFYERHDLNAVLDQLRADRPQFTQQLVLFGISLGTAVALATAQDRDDLTALVLESPFADYRSAVRGHASWIGLPTGPTLWLAMQFAQWISGTRFDDVRPISLLQHVRCPVLMIRGENELMIPPNDLAAIDAAVANHGGQVWIVPEAGHMQAVRVAADEYSRRIDEFLRGCSAVRPPLLQQNRSA